MKKLLIICQFALIVLLLVSIPLIALSEEQRYVSSLPPSDSMIIKKADEMRRCPKEIKKIVGKLQTSENIWVVYYDLIPSKSKKSVVYDRMLLKKLDTSIWILECDNSIGGRTYDTFYNEVY